MARRSVEGMRRYGVTFLSGLFGLVALAATSQSAVDLVQLLHDESGATAAGVAVWSDDTADIAVIGTTQSGGEDVAGAAPWHLGSNGKSMTALLVARLVREGTISWEDRVGDVLGAQISDIHPDLAKADYEDLLTHRSGLPANPPMRFLRSLSGLRDDVMADRLVYASRVLGAAPAHAPGSFAYSNAGYVVVGAMLEAVTGRTWEALMTTHVFEPLELDSAGFGAPQGPGIPLGHRGRMLGLGMVAVAPGPRADNVAAMGPAGRIHMAPDDYLDYLIVTASQPTDILPAEFWARLHTPPDETAPYALGWAVGPDGVLSHDGSNTLWYARAMVSPGKWAAAFLVNRGSAAASMNTVGAAFIAEQASSR